MEWKLPVDDKTKEAFDNIETKYPSRGDEKVLQSYYNSWATTYDEDCIKLRYTDPDVICDAASRIATEENKETWSVLDFGAGTGLVGRALRTHGFIGEMVGVDFSQNMLNEAKSIFDFTLIHHITAGCPMPFNDEKFDLVVAGGSFGRSAITTDCLPEAFRVLRKGGHVILTQRVSMSGHKYLESFDKVLQDMISAGQIKLTEKKSFPKYLWKCEDEEMEELTGRLLVLLKL